MIIGSPAPTGTVVVIHLSPSRGEALARILRAGSHRASVVAPGPGAVPAIVAAAPDLIVGPLVCGEMSLTEMADHVRRQLASDVTVLALLGLAANVAALAWKRRLTAGSVVPLVAIAAIVPWVYLWHYYRGVIAFRHRPRLT